MADNSKINMSGKNWKDAELRYFLAQETFRRSFRDLFERYYRGQIELLYKVVTRA